MSALAVKSSVGARGVAHPTPHASFAQTCRLIDPKNARRYDDCLKYTIVSGKKALRQAGLEKEANPEGFGKLDPTRVGVLVGTGMGEPEENR